jgi:hypothetical protein
MSAGEATLWGIVNDESLNCAEIVGCHHGGADATCVQIGHFTQQASRSDKI